MTASTLSCGCDMPIPIYADWCQDQGWDADELRVGEEVVVVFAYCLGRWGDGWDYENCVGDGHYYTAKWQYPSSTGYGSVSDYSGYRTSRGDSS